MKCVPTLTVAMVAAMATPAPAAQCIHEECSSFKTYFGCYDEHGCSWLGSQEICQVTSTSSETRPCSSFSTRSECPRRCFFDEGNSGTPGNTTECKECECESSSDCPRGERCYLPGRCWAEPDWAPLLMIRSMVFCLLAACCMGAFGFVAYNFAVGQRRAFLVFTSLGSSACYFFLAILLLILLAALQWIYYEDWVYRLQTILFISSSLACWGSLFIGLVYACCGCGEKDFFFTVYSALSAFICSSFLLAGSLSIVYDATVEPYGQPGEAQYLPPKKEETEPPISDECSDSDCVASPLAKFVSCTVLYVIAFMVFCFVSFSAAEKEKTQALTMVGYALKLLAIDTLDSLLSLWLVIWAHTNGVEIGLQFLAGVAVCLGLLQWLVSSVVAVVTATGESNLLWTAPALIGIVADIFSLVALFTIENVSSQGDLLPMELKILDLLMSLIGAITDALQLASGCLLSVSSS